MAIKTASDVTKFAKDNKSEIVDLKFCDVPGLWQHFSVSANEFVSETASSARPASAKSNNAQASSSNGAPLTAYLMTVQGLV